MSAYDMILTSPFVTAQFDNTCNSDDNSKNSPNLNMCQNIGNNNNDDDDDDPKTEDSSILIRRRKNTEASKRFRQRRKARINDNITKLNSLNDYIRRLNQRIDSLIDENKYWKTKVDTINELKLKRLLNNIKSNSK